MGDGIVRRNFVNRGVGRGFFNVAGLGRWLEKIIIIVVVRENGKRVVGSHG